MNAASQISPGANFLNALRGRPCARIPFQEMEVSPRHTDAFLGRPLGLAAQRLPPETYAEFTLASGQSMLYFSALWKAGRVYRADSDGRLQYVDGSVRTLDDLARLEPFDIESACAHLAALGAAARRHGLAVTLAFPTPFRLALYAMGYTEFFIRLHDDPDFIAAVIEHFRKTAGEYLCALLRQPVDAFLVAGSICTGSGPMLSPRLIRDVWLKDTCEFLTPVRALDLPVILHMDGDFSGIADLLMEAPIDAVQPFEVTGNLDIAAFQKRYGSRVTVWGNVDLSGVLTRGTPDAVREDVRQHIEQLGSGRYILSSSHEIPEDVPIANWLALVDAAREFGGVFGGKTALGTITEEPI